MGPDISLSPERGGRAAGWSEKFSVQFRASQW